MQITKRPIFVLVLAFMTIAGFMSCILLSARTAPLSYVAVQLDAAGRMQACMDEVKAQKAVLGIALSDEDVHMTGMLGEEYNFITTTLGSLEAKRTTANPDMAALVVRMFYEAGLKRGDRVGAGFSGSFPALNIAVLAACDAMGIEVVYVASVGSSMYGANNPTFTFPEMACHLTDSGLIGTMPALITLGGDQDIGIGMDEQLLASIRHRLDKLPVPLLIEPDLEKNITRRMALYDEGGIDLFVSVGGNLTSLGNDEDAYSQGQGLLRPVLWGRIRPDSGLIERYRIKGIPVINLLNIQKIFADYGMPYDPKTLPERGKGIVYCTRQYNSVLIIGALLTTFILLLWYRRLSKKHETGHLC